MRTRTEQLTHGICGWGVILAGVFVMAGPAVVSAEMPRAVYYDTAPSAKGLTASASQDATATTSSEDVRTKGNVLSAPQASQRDENAPRVHSPVQQTSLEIPALR